MTKVKVQPGSSVKGFGANEMSRQSFQRLENFYLETEKTTAKCFIKINRNVTIGKKWRKIIITKRCSAPGLGSFF